MRPLWVGMLLVSLPLIVLAQQGPVLRETPPPDQPEVIPPSPDDQVTTAPLPPPDPNAPPASDQPEMVPNPLEDPNVVHVPGQGEQPRAPQGQPRPGGWVQMGTASLQALDKVNARAQTINVKVGEIGHFGSLDIAVRGCFVRPSDRPQDATALLVIHDQNDNALAFSGWMLRSEPSMSMLAHPIYDIRVNGCAP